MSDYNWCHGPSCHKRKTTTRVRGVKGSKVLRTMKVKYTTPPEQEANRYYWFRHWGNYFCDQTCLFEFVEKNIQGMIALAPRPEALETPIEDPVKTQNAYGWIRTEIKEVDNNSNIG
jgi:hypothetical protein